MWLLPAFSALSRNALKVFYRLAISGARVPARGPVLLVANHPNSLLDPAMVAAVARRPVRFLAKAPLFHTPGIGWLVKGAGAIPVYRRQDDPSAVGHNDDTFRAVWAALGEGSAVGIFPEGTSHSEPALVPIKTGAARIALGAARMVGGAFPIIPVGLSLRDKQRFRSHALAVVGDAVEWSDLAANGPEDHATVHALTRRIDAALHEVTVNLERWDDAPLVEAAEAIYAAELPVSESPAARVARQREAAEGLARVRQEERAEWLDVARDVNAHARLLRVLGMTPGQLAARNRGTLAVRWIARQLVFFGLGVPVAAFGVAVYYLPYRLTGFLVERTVRDLDVRATGKLLGGIAIHGLWTILLASVLGWRCGARVGLCALVVLPLVGFVTLHVVERWARAVGEARRFFLRARRAREFDALRHRQHDLARRLHALWEQVRG